ncbi:MAG: hypothetical protein RIM84_05865 [Alphaproteobacteria bacterium]
MFDRWREAALVVLGIVLALVPLALWLAWSEFFFYLALAVFGVAFGLFALVVRSMSRAGRSL